MRYFRKYFRKQFGPNWCFLDIGLAFDFWYHFITPRVADEHKRTQVISIYWDSLKYRTRASGKASGLYFVFLGLLIGIVHVKEEY